ncbi:MAG: hypothetical protein HY399_03510 [Elusimicrobia bacterium]|nr:hypothetical protein [Elusimicrobiota bacterium]
MFRKSLILLVLYATLLPRAGQGSSLSFSGYFKNLYQYTRSPINSQLYWQNLDRLRLTFQGSYKLFRGYVDYDQEFFSGTYFNTPDFGLFGLGDPPVAWNMDQPISRGRLYLWRHRVYRGWGGLESDNWVLRVGRQRIAWGTGKLWNPTDVLNPYQPLSIERGERRGVDAGYFRKSWGALNQMEGAYTLENRWADRSFLGRARTHFGRGDFSFMGGKIAGQKDSWMMGGDMAVDVWEGSLHAEFSVTQPKASDSFVRYLWGYEYNFSSAPLIPWLKDTWVLVEYYHNGAGASDPRFYKLGAVLSGKEVTLARNYVGAGFSRDLHPLLKLEIYSMVNLEDSSTFVGPSLDWNPLENLHLLAGWQILEGKRTTEFGRPYSIPYIQGQYFF